MSTSKWESLAKLMSKQKTTEGAQLILNTNNQCLLVALLLWARVNITLGKKFTDFDTLGKVQLEEIAMREICATQADDSAELEDLADTKQYISWRLKFQRFCRHWYNSEGVPYSYVIRDKVPPKDFNTLMEELVYLLPVDMSNAQFRVDSNLVHSYLESAIKEETGKPLVQRKSKLSEQCGRSVFLAMNARFEGDDAKPLNLSEVETKIGKVAWNNSPNFSAERFTSTLCKHFNTLEENGSVWTEPQKIRAMTQAICRNTPDLIQRTPWIHNVRDRLQEEWNTWSFQDAIAYFHAKARMNVKSTRSASVINGKKGRANKSKKSRTETASTDAGGSGVSKETQQQHGYKNNGEPMRVVF